jgi:hypothetical protein
MPSTFDASSQCAQCQEACVRGVDWCVFFEQKVGRLASITVEKAKSN